VKNVDEGGRAIGTSSSKKKLGGAAIGAGVGGILGGALGGGTGAAIGAGAGAGAGLLFAVKFTTSGTDMEFAPGSQFVLDVSDRPQR
jgi:outer membrane lipoprotein SlyB